MDNCVQTSQRPWAYADKVLSASVFRYAINIDYCLIYWFVGVITLKKKHIIGEKKVLFVQDTASVLTTIIPIDSAS